MPSYVTVYMVKLVIIVGHENKTTAKAIIVVHAMLFAIIVIHESKLNA
jgi:hypothetical protein